MGLCRVLKNIQSGKSISYCKPKSKEKFIQFAKIVHMYMYLGLWYDMVSMSKSYHLPFGLSSVPGIF